MQCRFGGKFWARMPQGESRFDVAQRIHQAFGTFQRDAIQHGIRDIVVICHGVTLRAFVMMWCHLSPEWFEEEPNPANCAIRLVDHGVDRGYLFEGFRRS
jgi:2,3-bisphosphoglycerate-dependent phosphoglycerate mutase